MAFQIEFKPKAVKDMDKLTSDIAVRVIKKLEPGRRHWRHPIGLSIGRSRLSTPWAAS